MPAGRQREFDPETALEAAMQTFWSQGYEATSLQDLLKSMGLSKSSFYQTFGSKHALFTHCLDRYRDDFTGLLRAGLDAAPSGLAFIRAMLHGVADEAHLPQRRGCLVMNTASEFGQSDCEVAEHVTTATRAFRKVFRQAVERAQSEGDIPADRHADTLAHYVVANMGGLRTLAKSGASREELIAIADIALDALT